MATIPADPPEITLENRIKGLVRPIIAAKICRLPPYVDPNMYITVICDTYIRRIRKSKLDVREQIGDAMLHHRMQAIVYSSEAILVNSELLVAVAALRALYWPTMSRREQEKAERDRVREQELLRRRAEETSDSDEETEEEDSSEEETNSERRSNK